MTRMKIRPTIGLALAFALVMSAELVQARSWDTLQCGDEWGPKSAVAPAYPRRAQERGLEGSVVMGFTINLEGKVEDIEVVEGHSAFVRSATRAVEKLEFPPCVKDGLATRQANVSIKYDFHLTN